jgi:hypothetical protein
MTHSITVECITWENVEIEITHETGKFGAEHIEIRSINPINARNPITETGYRSHFMPLGALEAHGLTAKELVMEWLKRESDTVEWKKYAESQRQGDLFAF